MTLDNRHSAHNHHYRGTTSAHIGHVIAHGGVSTTPRPKSVATDVMTHQEPTDGSASMVRSNTVGGGLEDVDAMLVGPMATSTPLNVSRNRCNCHCSSSSVDNQENLADVTQYFMQRSFEESLSHSGRMSAARRALQKTAATQTATATADNTTCTSVTPTSSRTPEVPPDYLTLSPRTAQASASSSRKSSRRRNASRDSSSRKAYTSIDSDTDESIDDELMEVDLHSTQQRLMASNSRHSLSSCHPSEQLETSSSPEHKSQSSQKQLAAWTHRRSISKEQVAASSFDASSTTLTTVDALLNVSYELNEDSYQGAAASPHNSVATEICSLDSRHAVQAHSGKSAAQQPTAVASPAHEKRARKGQGARRSPCIDSNNPQVMSYAQYLLQPACDFPEEITGSFSAEVLNATGAEDLNSPDSESSSSRFTERESSCKSSTSSSAGVHREMARGSHSLQGSAGAGQASTQESNTREASLGLPLEEVKSDSTSADYITATEGKNSKTITKGLSSHEGSTSLESAPEISLCPGTTPGEIATSVAPAGSGRERGLEALDLPSPSVELPQPGERHRGVELPLSSESEDDSTKKDDEREQETGDREDDEPEAKAIDNDDQSSEGEYSLGTAENIEGETDKSDDDAEEDETLGRRDEEPMECMVPTSLTMLPSPIETSSPKTSHKGFSNNETQQQQQPTHICEVFEDEIHGKALILPLMTFRDVQNALGRAELRQYDELSTVSEVSEENSTSEHQVTERYTPTSSCGSTGTIKRIYRRADSPQRKYFQEVHNEASVLDQDSTNLKDTSSELNASNDSGGACIEVTPNDSADSLSMTFRPEEIPAIMYGPVGGKTATVGPQTTAAPTTERPQPKKEASSATTATSQGGSAAGCEAKTSDETVERPTKVDQPAIPLTSNETRMPAPPCASARVTTVSAEIHQRGSAHDINSKASPAGSSCRNGGSPRSDGVVMSTNKDHQYPTVAVSAAVVPTNRSAPGRPTESGPKEGSSTESGTPSSTPTSNSSSSDRKERQNANGDPPPNTKRNRTHSRGSITESSVTTLNQCIVTSSQRREDNEDCGIHSDSFISSRWIYISKEDEMLAWKSNNNNAKNNNTEEKDESLIIKTSVSRCDSTESERAFQKQYTTITHRMIHRKASLEMYKRVTQRSLEPTKTVKIERQNGEFGFRIHGSRPVVVSAIEKGTPAESCGLEVGDIVVSINGVKVMDASHTEVVRVAHACAETLKLELARTCHILAPKVDVPEPEMQGFLQRLSSTSSSRRWCRRWFVLKKSGQLCWFMAHGESDPLGALMTDNLRVERVIEPGAEHAFKVTFTCSASGGNNSKKNGAASVGGGTYFAADDEDSATKWIMAFKKMASPSLTHQERYLEEVRENLQRPVNTMTQIDCQGFLCKYSDRAGAWRSYYLVLKDASLYIYEDRNDLRALGVYLLHGYRVQSSSAMGKRNVFEAIAPGSALTKNLLFLAETEQEKKRWLASLEYSIDRWLRL
ncbi:mucin-19-like isoform X2 [Varroa destructor]|nr:mucin-19-like isoform X2 [Varroa destructor]